MKLQNSWSIFFAISILLAAATPAPADNRSATSGVYPIFWYVLPVAMPPHTFEGASGTAEAVAYSGGKGEPNDPYLIATPNDLNSICLDSNDWDKHFKMVADINLANYPVGFVTPIGWGVDWTTEDLPFTGVFDGNGFNIIGWSYTYDKEDEEYTGLFGYINDANAEVRNLRLIRPQVSRIGWAGGPAGALVGYIESGSIYDCHVQDANIKWMDTVGGAIGQNGGNITICSANGEISGECEVAGFVGYNKPGGVISECSASANITSTATGSGGFVALNQGIISSSNFIGTVNGVWQVGGFVSSNSAYGIHHGEILKSFAIANVNGYRYVGGFASINRSEAKIINCYAQGSAEGDRWVGGLIGQNLVGKGSYSYSASQVHKTGTETGGLIGEDFQGNGEFQSLFWDTTLNPDVNGIGNGSDPNVIGLTTAEMQTAATFINAGWDFVDIWTICEGTNYPKFLWRILPADFLCPDGVDFIDYAYFSAYWLDTNCALSSDCDGTDFDLSDNVDANDLKIFFNYWLQGEN